MKDCRTCKYGYEDEQFGIPMCHHPNRFSEDCVDFNMHEEKETETEQSSSSEIPNDLEEASNEYAEKHGFRVPYDGSDNFYDDVDVKASKEGFIAGAKWDRSKMMKEAVEGKVFMSFAPGHNQMVMADVDLPTNTKVRIIIVKEN